MYILKLIGAARKSKVAQKVGTLISVGALCVINLGVNGPLRLKAMSYLDDLILWNFFNVIRNNPLGFVFSTYSNKYRPVSNGIYLGLFSLFQYRPWLFGIFNVFFSFCIATLLFFLFRRISKNGLVSFLLSAVFIVCRFAYYDIAQVYGVMEAGALLFSILLLYLLWRFLNTKNEQYFWASVGVFFLLIFDHERFVPIILLYLVVFLILGIHRRNIMLFVASTLPVILNFAIKGFIFKKLILEGTGGTSLYHTFSTKGFLEYFGASWLYILGINAGPTDLNGITAFDAPLIINVLIGVNIICLLILLVLFLSTVLRNKKGSASIYKNNCVLFFTFIFVNLISASVTIRIETRWLYIPFVGLLFLLAYMLSVVSKKRKTLSIYLLVFFVWVSVVIPREMLYRNYFKSIYFSSVQNFGNALYDATIKKYGDDFWNYDTYILCSEKPTPKMIGCNDYGDLYLFFSQFNKKHAKTRIHFVTKTPEIVPGSKSILLHYNQQRGKFE